MEGDKYGNVLWYSYWRTHPHVDPCIEKKYINNNSHINNILVMIIRISDFTIMILVHITRIGIGVNLL